MKIVRALVIYTLIIAACMVIFVFSGIYNISATAHHLPPTLWLIEKMTDRSVDSHAPRKLQLNLNDTAMLHAGFQQYRDLCVWCHGAPGVNPDQATTGMYPNPTDLSDAAKDTPPAKLFWIVKNGIKLTGMPSFAVTLSDDQIRSIVVFVHQLPAMTTEQYHQLSQKAQQDSN